jgi:predicted metal-dependent phosphoesterase TrpH
MGKIDLHVHTNSSDGKYSPSEIVAIAACNGVTLLAITDHDTVNGVREAQLAARAFPEMRIIAGVEISSHAPGSEVHILGYFVNIENADFLKQMAILNSSRIERATAMVAKLKAIGLDINIERVRQLAGAGSIGRPHIAQALIEKGYVNSFQEVFTRYLGQGCPAYVERIKLSPTEAIKLILRNGGLPVLAHPTTVCEYESVIAKSVTHGLAGLECYYGDYPTEQRNELSALAKRYSLITTGGSDFHGIDGSTEVMLGEAGVPTECGENIMRVARERGVTISQ